MQKAGASAGNGKFNIAGKNLRNLKHVDYPHVPIVAVHKTKNPLVPEWDFVVVLENGVCCAVSKNGDDIIVHKVRKKRVVKEWDDLNELQISVDPLTNDTTIGGVLLTAKVLESLGKEVNEENICYETGLTIPQNFIKEIEE